MLDLSIILPTCNRAPLLQRALDSIAATVRCSHEIIVVDGASTDSTPEILATAKDQLGDRFTFIREEKRGGFVKAANKGFRAARGRNMIWLNDDVRPIADALDQAVTQLDSEPADVAFLALFHRWHSTKNVAYEMTRDRQVYRLCHVRGTLYANFPLGRRQTFENLGLFDERFYFFAADPDLSLKAWHAGLRIVPAYGAVLDHDQHEDPRRSQDSSSAQADNRKLFEKWDLPPKNPTYNDFDPARPCTLRGLTHDTAVKAA